MQKLEKESVNMEPPIIGGGEMGNLIRKKDWQNTPVGPSHTWPPSLIANLQLIIESPFPMMILWGPEYIQFYNDAYIPIFGSKHPGTLGINVKDSFTDVWTAIGPMIEAVMKGEQVRLVDMPLMLDNNGVMEERNFDFAYSPLRTPDGAINGVLVTVMETTEKVKILNALRDNEQNLKNLISQAPVAITVLKGETLIIELANDKMFRIWGKDASEVLNKPMFVGVPEARYQGLESMLLQVYKTGERFVALERPVELGREDGSLHTVFLNFVIEPFFAGDGVIAGVIGVAIDVTNQVRARNRVELAEERARLAIDAANLGTFDFEINTNEAFTSERLFELFDVHPSSVPAEITKNIHPDDRIIRQLALEQAMKTGRLEYEVRIVRRSGRINWVHVEGKVLYDTNQNPTRMLGTAMDITEKKEQDEKREEYIAFASHELRSPLASLKLSLDMLSELISEPEETLFLNKARSQYQRIMLLSDELLNVSKIAAGVLELKPEIFNLATAVDESVAAFQSGKEKNPITVNGNSNISVEGDRFRIEQVLVNLISNAAKYSPPGSPIEIDVNVEKDHIQISVSDKGIGIDEDKIPQIFRKFSRIKETGNVKGYGLGLYISAQIIKKHGGEIGLESKKGLGSKFWFRIPR